MARTNNLRNSKNGYNYLGTDISVLEMLEFFLKPIFFKNISNSTNLLNRKSSFKIYTDAGHKLEADKVYFFYTC